MMSIQFKLLSQSPPKELLNSRFARFLMRESAHCVGSNPGLLKESLISKIQPKNSNGTAIQRITSRLMIIAKPQEQQFRLPALARHTQLPPVELRHSLNSQNIIQVECKLIDSLTTLTPPPKSGKNITRTITQKLEKYLARPRKKSMMRETKCKREHFQKRLKMTDPMSNRESQALLEFFLQA
ncbi:MAG: hypothetical protein EZS28_042415 [Streblomastix strix]|uniref:Uncharacterized protein n=1 Tax=Streblomastix strix TaxID=222440 RepID=A0A5J4TUV4_9EUKA|nr:MAG: hypothetical protein EZS28_042415 [Streblomastix strix]